MKVIAVIPARGGSVGLPGKNIKPLNGVPLVARAVLAAVNSAFVSDVYVSSDSSEILGVAASFGATGISRPAEISGPTASSESALIHTLHEVERMKGTMPDVVVFLQCTSPFTTSEQIDAVVSKLLEDEAASAFSAIEDHGFIWQIADEGTAAGITHDHTRPRQRRQDMTPRYRETGAIYAMRVPEFLAEGNRFCGKTVLVPVEMPPIEVDTAEDWTVAEAYARLRDPHRLPQLKKIKALITDFDGVHTDDRVIVGQDGSEAVRCSRSDGMGIEILRQSGLKMLILSREQNPVVKARAAKLQMDVLHHIRDKLPALDAWRTEQRLEWAEIAYVGNDINDLDCMKVCGMSFTPSDAHPEAKAVATMVLQKAGGNGALRDLSEFLISNDLIG
ncbi:acylneuraminate cytidylyltransferase (plasmid) [Sinorhizobium meliloti]|uniref:acylneuraminate cytidylyltransferase n=1 Tax=Rhizobium meliloti TaxID=382 RepID=UPI000D1D9822|nr:acylneuraminate cytidylyltransferase [Sinorhizobium meliloti]RMI08040.1 acylneuraminate cytidylyltransferase [Sinorhizobium meliloti]WQO98178.1 acylneuraminate cytidylyltransferase [Sinorhizobium meliloti]